MTTAVITGGSSGIGLIFAEQLAARGLNLILVAREQKKLQQVSQELAERYHISVQTIVADLADHDNVEMVAGVIARTKNLAYMVNNAGFATHVNAADANRQAHQLQRNAITVMALDTIIFSSTAAAVMKKQGYGRIINIASTSAWTFQGAYSAIKGCVLTYTQGLALNLEGSGVTATAVCPAWMHTNFHKAAGLGEPSIPEWLYVKPKQVVEQALKGADNGKRIVIPTIRWRIIIWILGHGPIALRRQISRIYLNSSNYHKKSKK